MNKKTWWSCTVISVLILLGLSIVVFNFPQSALYLIISIALLPLAYAGTFVAYMVGLIKLD